MSVRPCSLVARRCARIVSIFVVRTVLGIRKPPLPFSIHGPFLFTRSPIYYFPLPSFQSLSLTHLQSKEKAISRWLPGRRLLSHLQGPLKILLSPMPQSLPRNPSPGIIRRPRCCLGSLTCTQVRALRPREMLRMPTCTHREGPAGT